MENRFGLKDLLVVALLITLIVMLAVKFIQDDRQWSRLNNIDNKIDQQTKDVTALRRLIREGGLAVAQNNNTPASGNPYENTIQRRRWHVTQMPDYAEGGQMIEAFSASPPKLNYFTSHSTASRIVYSKVLENLAEWDIETLEMVPNLSTGWRWSEDELSLDVDLRTDVVFSDGEPMDADDVIYTWKLKKDPEITDGQTRAYYAPIRSIEKLDQHKIRFTFEKIHYENFMRAMEVHVLPMHFFEKLSKQEIRENRALIVGTGPYRMIDPMKYSPGDKTIELVRNERYWGKPPALDRIIWRVIDKDPVRLVAFLNGEVDFFLPTPEQHVTLKKMLANPDEQSPEVRERLENTNHLVYTHLRAPYWYIDWNQFDVDEDKSTIFADKRVRQALTMLIDREGLVEQIYFGMATVVSGPFRDGSGQTDPSIKPWPYDPDRAIAQLESLGFTRDEKGVLHTPDGEPWVIELKYVAGSDFVEKCVLFFKDNLATAGIEFKLRPREYGLLLEDLRNRNYEAAYSGWGGGSTEGDIEQMFHSKNIDNRGDNRNNYRNPKLDALIDRAHITLDRDERMKIWQECHRILHEDQPYTFMVSPMVRLWTDKKLHNIKPFPGFGINYVSTWSVPLEWYIPAEYQAPTD